MAQERTITGNVRDSAGQGLPSASVKLVDDKGTIIRFAFTNETGAFSLTLPGQADTLLRWLEVSHIAYRKQRMALSAARSVYNFNLLPDEGLLKEVVVQQRQPIVEMGDTLRYDVDRFAQDDDRSIGDVLRRMPGVEVSEDGTISHNGKKISNLYIEGDDLMSGRYGTATKVINKDMIISVDIIRNHQPIKVLKDKIFSDNTVVNLVLKDPARLKMSGSGIVGGGFPALYNVSATSIVLNDRLKALNNIAFNNNGVNYRDDFKQLGSPDFISTISNTPPEFSLSQGTIGAPDLPLPTYYFNHSGIINLNELYKSKKGLQLKLSLQAFKDRNSLDYFSRTDNYLQGDTISFLEQQSFTNRPSLWNTSLNMMLNKNNYFFNNTFRFEFVKEDNSSYMNFNDYTFNQSVSRKIRSFSNDINWISSFSKKSIGELRWLLSYNGNNQSLDIGKGYYFQIPNQQDSYDEVIQSLSIPTVFSNFYLGYKIPGNVVAQQYTAGFILESESFDSRLQLVKNATVTPYQGDAGNNLDWDRNNIYVSSEYQIKYKRLKSTIKLPVSYQRIHYSQQEYNLDSKNGNLLFNPSVTVNYDFDPEHFMGISYFFNRNFSDISGVFRGGILRNYRTFVANDADLQEKANHSIAATYNFQKAINMLFANIGISYDKINANAVLSTVFTDNIQKTVFLPYRNSQNRLSLRAGFSKYLFGLKTTASLRSVWSRYRYLQILNNQAQPFYNDVLSFSAKIMKKIAQRTSLVYEPRGIWNTSGPDKSKNGTGRPLHRAFRLDQYLSIVFAPVNRMNVELSGKHSLSKQSNNDHVHYFFMDAKATYTLTNKRMDFSFSVTNLFNVTDYILYSLSPYQFNVDEYHIRGRMGVLKLSYYF
jgi:hypothetical protein